MIGLVKNQTHKKTTNYRPPVRRSEKSYLFDQQIRSKQRDDRELDLVCKEVIRLECQYRIHGHLNQDPIAILNAAIDQSSTNLTFYNLLDYYGQFYKQIQEIDHANQVT
jgi:hypothetical protein